MRNKLRFSILTIACAGLIIPRMAFPIGRIGNLLIGDISQGYSAEVPVDFNQIIIADQGSAILQSNYILDPEFGLTQQIQAQPFGQIYPALTNSSPTEVLVYFQAAKGMTYTTATTPNCSLSLLGEGETTWVGVSTWGQGRGYVLVGPKTDQVKAGILSILANTVITTSCWM